MNKGLKLATGDIIAILNSDDFYADKNVVSDIIMLFETSNADAIYADLDYVNQKDSSMIIRKWRSGKYKQNMFKWGWMPPHPTLFVKNNVYKK